MAFYIDLLKVNENDTHAQYIEKTCWAHDEIKVLANGINSAKTELIKTTFDLIIRI